MIVSVLLMIGMILCSGCVAQSQSNTQPPVKSGITAKKITFQKYIPQKLIGTYYRTNKSEYDNSDDEFMELKIRAHSLFLGQIGNDFEIKWDKVDSQPISENTYILQSSGDDWFIKLKLLPENNVSISRETRYSRSEALKDHKMMTYAQTKPQGYFGLTIAPLERHYYLSNRDPIKYYYFNNSVGGSYLRQGMNMPEPFKSLSAKTNGYLLSNPYSDNQKLLLPIADNQLQDAQTGEVFTQYPHSSQQFYAEMNQKLGIPEPQPTSPMPTPPKKVPEKTYDFADDQDDDYYDTYDDFDLNNGD